jgi:hypothetical protein
MRIANNSVTAHLFFALFLCLSQFFSFVTNASAQTPSLPINLYPNEGAQLKATTQVTLSWSTVPGATHYNVRANNWTNSTQRDPRNNCPSSPHYLCVDVLAATSIALPVNSGSSYGFFLQACNASGCGGVSAANFSVLIPPPPPSQITGLSPVGIQAVGTVNVQLRWNLDPNATAYYVRANDNTNVSLRFSGNNCPNSPHYFCVNGITSSSISMPVLAGHSYGWFMNACNASGCGPVSTVYFSIPDTPPPVPGNVDIIVPLDDGSIVKTRSLSTLLTEAEVRTLVLVADRSTVQKRPYNLAGKGLIKPDDRIVITDNYIAWLSYTKAAYSRSGELAGVWTLNPATRTFKYFVGLNTAEPSPNYWPRNELIPGSEASKPNGQPYFWDKFAPPTEHTIGVIRNSDGAELLLAHNYIKDAGALVELPIQPTNTDGTLSFVTSGVMATFNGVTDVGGSISSRLEYRFSPTNIDSIWNFTPSANLISNNVYVFLWLAYAPGYVFANPPCDARLAGELPISTFASNLFVRSAGVSLITNYNANSDFAGPVLTYSPGSTPPIQIGAGKFCQANYFNFDIGSTSFINGASIEISPDQAFSGSSRKTKFTHLPLIPSANGVPSSVTQFPFARLLAWKETRDGTQGFGMTKGPYNGLNVGQRFTLIGGTQYQAAFRITVQ